MLQRAFGDRQLGGGYGAMPEEQREDVEETTVTRRNESDRDLRRPRKITFFSNGDRYFPGKKLYITPHRYFVEMNVIVTCT